MRGGYLHNMVLIESVASVAGAQGARVWREFPVHHGSESGYIDLLIEFGTYRVAVEAELTTKRIARDLAKGTWAAANEIWILVPDARTARAVRRTLNRSPRPPSPIPVFVLTQGQAKQRVRNSFPFYSRPNVSSRERENNGRP